ncbi:MAG: sugar transferase [Patescibacteria group bacterium]
MAKMPNTPSNGWGVVVKRTVDVCGAAVGLVFLSPLFFVIAVMIKLGSRGPVFVGLDRISEGKLFRIWKFRSMIDNADAFKVKLRRHNNINGPFFKMHNDPRVTRIGRVLRAWCLDELPQLWNVLTGEMSLVGPRPNEPQAVAQYGRNGRRLIMAKGGMTGTVQLAALLNDAPLPYEEMMRLDAQYLKHWSLFLDAKIIVQTLCALTYRRGR